MTDPSLHRYQAITIIQGELVLNGDHPVLDMGGSTFPVYASKVVRKKHQPGQVQNFRVYPCVRHKQTAFQLVNVVETPPTPLTLHGCWELHKGSPFFIIYRNEILFPGHQILLSIVPVVGESAPPADGQFWMAEAEISEGEFIITKAVGPFDPPPKATQFVPPVSTKVKPEPIPAPPAPVLPLTIQEIRTMATAAKISLTCKLSEVPKHRELPEKRIEFFLQDGESDRIFTVRMKSKMFKKLTDHGFTQWVAAISGELGPATETGFELLNAAVQVFEKKATADAPAAQEKASANETKPTSDKASATARPQTPKAEAQAGAGKRKSL